MRSYLDIQTKSFAQVQYNFAKLTLLVIASDAEHF